MEGNKTKKPIALFDQITVQPHECISSSHTVDEITFKKIDVLHNQIIACQQESVSYNNSFLSSSVICAILAASAGWISNNSNGSWSSELLYIFYALPIVYFLMLYNLAFEIYRVSNFIGRI